jgi:hypothetical protein
MIEFLLQALIALLKCISDVGRCCITKMFLVTNVEWLFFLFSFSIILGCSPCGDYS